MSIKKQNFKIEKSNFKTNYRRTFEASPFFDFSNYSTIASSKSWLIDIGQQNNSAQKYLPLTNLRIVNNSTEDIAIFPNQQAEGMIIPAGTVLTFDRKTVPALNSLKVQNIDASATIGENKIKVTFWKEAIEMDQAFNKMHKAFFKFLYSWR